MIIVYATIKFHWDTYQLPNIENYIPDITNPPNFNIASV